MCVAASGGTEAVGRSVKQTRQAGLSDCSECCSTDECNDQLCLHKAPNQCVDDETIDCAKLSSLFNVCTGNYEHAALVCPRTCNLCNYTNGNWADWTSWSACTITCGSTTQMRTRTCTNPPPSTHGKNCEGPTTDYKSCVRDACPVDGNWGAWTTWESCSATCGVGIQHRNRLCDNPPPARFGDLCFGDSLDYRMCMIQGCSDGGWATWSLWSSCSATCDGGTSQRYRECTNPSPSPYGQQCHGPNSDFKVCSIFPCQPPVRLTDGRFEIFINGQWGTVCDDHFDTNGATVACRMLELRTANARVIDPPAGPSGMPIWLDDVVCKGNEHTLLECDHRHIGYHNCIHTGDVGLVCA
ncbi:hypothetical protein DPMN_029452 [Dreissena polymorpha]|uniref:Uncharacterized protein n=1 Tax=Dreissena polymorpha TaxID=45954 RepID=A0A9D4LYQ7_DREPO|nr:hypothetical protein DPMN_029452 [Dreissena polymorpha]